MLLRADGFDHWGTSANFTANYPNFNGTFSITTNAAFVRTGTSALQHTFGNGFDASYWSYIVSGLPNALLVSVAIRPSAIPLSDVPFIAFSHSTSNRSDNQVSICVGADGSIAAYRGGADSNNGVLLGRSEPNQLKVGTYTNIAIKAVIDNAAGSVEVRINGANDPVILFAGDTQNAADNAIARIAFGKPYSISGGNIGSNNASAGIAYFDDLVIFDLTGAFNNDFEGDFRCRTTFASANGPNQDWVSNSGGPAFEEISLVPPNPAANFISAAAIGNISNFAHDALPGNTSFVAGGSVFVQGFKSDSGAAEFSVSMNSAGVLTPAIPCNPSTAAGYFFGTFEADPNTGNYWTKDNFNNAMLQFERTA